MCGRFVQFSLFPILKKEFGLKFGEEVELFPSYNIAPTQDVPVVVNEGGNRLISCRWGLIAPWSKDMTIGSHMINARAETLAEKPSFKGPFKKHRCLVVADGFYEWKKPDRERSRSTFTWQMIRLLALQAFSRTGLPPKVN